MHSFNYYPLTCVCMLLFVLPLPILLHLLLFRLNLVFSLRLDVLIFFLVVSSGQHYLKFSLQQKLYVSYNSYNNKNTMLLLFCRLFYCCHQIAGCWMFMMFLKRFVMFWSCSTFENDCVMVEISCVYIFCFFHSHIMLINQLVLYWDIHSFRLKMLPHFTIVKVTLRQNL